MNRFKLAKNLIKIANNLDSHGLYQEANTVTKIAMNLDDKSDDKNPLDVDILDFDFDEMYDETEKGRIVELDNIKGQGKADIGEKGNPMIVDFKYLPEKNYGILEKNTQSKLQVGDIILISNPGTLTDLHAALGIIRKYSNKNFLMNSSKILE